MADDRMKPVTRPLQAGDVIIHQTGGFTLISKVSGLYADDTRAVTETLWSKPGQHAPKATKAPVTGFVPNMPDDWRVMAFWVAPLPEAQAPKPARIPTLKPHEIAITREQAASIIDLAERSGESEFFVAKDQGAYLGTNVTIDGERHSAIYYFRGCDPAKDPEFYERARDIFGGDDFGEHIPVTHLRKFIADDRATEIRFRVNKTGIVITTISP
jgi:hypothetical protein